jgi:lysophospholipase L1-like esterase
MKIVFMGDSITDMGRNREVAPGDVWSFGNTYALLVESELNSKFPKKHQVITKGISGNRVVDIYARIKQDCWNFSPDVVSILIGVNDVWHEIMHNNGVDIERYERIYDMYLADTKKALPNVKFMLLEPFVEKENATEERYEEFLQVREYAKVVKKLAEKHGAIFVPLQEMFDKASEQYGVSHWLPDGVHPSIAGAKLIANAWLEKFYSEIEK